MKTNQGKVSTEQEKPEEDELKREIETGEKDEDVYEEAAADLLEESDEISDVEEGFVEGYGEDLSKCALCGKIIKDDKPIELEINGEHYMFCSEDHAEKFKKQHRK